MIILCHKEKFTAKSKTGKGEEAKERRVTGAKFLSSKSLFNILKTLGAQGIVAEIPQDLHKQIRGIGAESPVFFGQGICAANSLTAKNAPENNRFPIGMDCTGRLRAPGMHPKPAAFLLFGFARGGSMIDKIADVPPHKGGGAFGVVVFNCFDYLKMDFDIGVDDIAVGAVDKPD
jgi:hypothetical protein